MHSILLVHIKKKKKGFVVMDSIKNLLTDLKLIDSEDVEIFSTKTRDRADIKVMRGKSSGVIFLEDFLSEDSVYESGQYRTEGKNLYGQRDYEIKVDVRRRMKDYEQFYVGKNIVDFGCGEGSFLKEVVKNSTSVVGVEIEKVYAQQLNDIGLKCISDLSKIRSNSIDTIFCFHTLEHLKDPITKLKAFKNSLCQKGHLIIEVPHANDFLLRNLNIQAFKNFTLWSQHLILHSRISLERFLIEAGFNNFIIQGKQRYNFSNHLNWLTNGEPGGHKNMFSGLDTDNLIKSYENSLQMIDATDTLVAIVEN